MHYGHLYKVRIIAVQIRVLSGPWSVSFFPYFFLLKTVVSFNRFVLLGGTTKCPHSSFCSKFRNIYLPRRFLINSYALFPLTFIFLFQYSSTKRGMRGNVSPEIIILLLDEEDAN